jgi:hypothetical protein
MAIDIPRPDIARFSPISLDDFTLASLGAAHRAVSSATLKARLRAFTDPAAIENSLAALAAGGKATTGKTIVLTNTGKDAAKSVLGRDVNATWESLYSQRFPLLVLGLDPDNSDIRHKFGKAEALTFAAIAVSFNLGTEDVFNKTGVCSELVWRLLRSALPGIIGKGPFPPISRLGNVERALLAGLSKTRGNTVIEAIGGLRALAVGLPHCNPKELRKQLIRIGLLRGLRPARLPPQPDGFATRVKEIAKSLSTPPFQGRVAIAQVYDAYGRLHPDAGSLASFKERLVTAARGRELELSRLDLPERMDRDLRLRSEAPWGTDTVHFVITEWK